MKTNSMMRAFLPGGIGRSVAAVSCGTAISCGGEYALDEPKELVSEAASEIASLGIERIIPIRFVQFVNTGGSPASDATLREQIEGTNAVFKPAGAQFHIKANDVIYDSVFTDIGGETYSWPAFGQSRPSVGIFAPGCNTPFLVGDMFGDLKQELGVLQPDTMLFSFYPSDSGTRILVFGGSIALGNLNAQAL